MNYKLIRDNLPQLEEFAHTVKSLVTSFYTTHSEIPPLGLNVYISGGVLAGIATKKRDNIGDVDLFCTTAQAYNRMYNWYQSETDKGNFKSFTNETKHSYNAPASSLELFTVKTKKPLIGSTSSIQVIYHHNKDIEQVMQSFDFTHLGAYFDAFEGYYASPITMYCLENKILLHNNPDVPILTEREEKYLKQGYKY